jgi:hypothetical protein
MMDRQQFLDAVVACGRLIDAQKERDKWIVVGPWALKQRAKAMGAPMGKHLRARSVRGRKRALMKSWRPCR